MSGSVVKVWLVFVALAAAAYGGFAAYRATRDDSAIGAPTETGKSGPVVLDASPQPLTGLEKLTLIERSGANFRFESLKGKVWVANSFFSRCNGECLKLTAEMRGMQNEFPELRLVSITSDPTEDTVEQMRSYATTNGANATRWSFVTGKAFDLQAANIELLATAELGPRHSKYIALVGADFKWQGMYNVMDSKELETLRENIRKLLAATVR